jgi:hypothetical protein
VLGGLNGRLARGAGVTAAEDDGAVGWIDRDELDVYAEAYAQGFEDGRRWWRRAAYLALGLLAVSAATAVWTWWLVWWR